MSTQTNLAESSIPALSERNEPMDIDLGERSEIEAEEANRERMDEEQHDEVEEEDAQEEEEEQEKEQDKNEEDGDESNEKKGKGKGKEKETEYEMDETSGERSAEWPFDSFPPIATLEPMAYEYTDVGECGVLWRRITLTIKQFLKSRLPTKARGERRPRRTAKATSCARKRTILSVEGWSCPWRRRRRLSRSISTTAKYTHQ